MNSYGLISYFVSRVAYCVRRMGLSRWRIVLLRVRPVERREPIVNSKPVPSAVERIVNLSLSLWSGQALSMVEWIVNHKGPEKYKLTAEQKAPKVPDPL
ncbi:MAG: hypothetical protein ACYTE3_18840 [Planctomycetota bacterium]